MMDAGWTLEEAGQSPMTHVEASARAWTLHRAKPVMLATLANLRALRDVPYAIGGEPSPHDAIVCGAGPSLTALLPQIAEARGVVYTVNTAAMAVDSVRRPDVLVAREIVDCAPQLVPCGEVVIDVGAHTGVLARAREVADRVSWFVPAGVHLSGITSTLGVRPLYGGTAALTAAVALAVARGARRVWLCGVDLAYADDGRAYADGSAYDGHRVELGADGLARHVGAGAEYQAAAHDRAGIPRHPERQATVEVPAFGGVGYRRALHTWEDQRRWLARMAQRVRMLHVAGAGARIGGGTAEVSAIEWDFDDDMRASSWSYDERAAARAPVHAWPWAMLDRVITQQVKTARSWAAALHADTPIAAVQGTIEGADIVETVVAGRLIQLREADLPMGERVRGLGLAFARGADEVEAAWGQ